MPRLIAVLLAAIVAAGGWGCSRKRKAWTVEPPPEDTLEELRALGYIDYASTAADLSKSGVTVHQPERVPPGYYAYGAVSCSAGLLDVAGHVVNDWKADTCVRWRATELMPNGDLLVVGIDERPPGGTRDPSHLSRYAWTGARIWKLEHETHHDVEVRPNGEILVLTTGQRQVPEYGERILDDRLTFVSPEGRVLRELSMFDMVRAAGFELEDVPVRKSVRDLLHTNSVATMTSKELATRSPIYEVGNVLVSSRRQDTLYVFNLEKERAIWAWGRGELDGPHDATVLANGHFLAFDNGWHRGESRVVEIDPMRNRIVWQFQGHGDLTFYSKSRGSAQRLRNGHTLIGNSNSGQALEIDEAGEPVWEFNNPTVNKKGHRGAIIRIRRYDPTLIGPLLER